ncbi:MAG: hypothetical protein FWE74_05045 [Oscillospiraceae bacterium]|nr:hypothetical protein [Oscillospiraceae bacterium]
MRLVLTLLFTVMLSGCAFGAVEDMLSPPRLTDEQQAIYSALADSKGTGFNLKYPRTGEHRSAFVIYGENEDAAIVFYEISGINVERALLMNFLYKDDSGRWESRYEIPIRGIEIESVGFVSFGEEAEESILLSYSVGQGEKKCMVISHVASKPVSQFDDIYSFMHVDYFFGRDYSELLIIKNDRSGTSAAATFYTYLGGQLFRSAQCELDPSAGEYTGVMQGEAIEGVPALFINHRKYDSADSYGTDLLFYRGNRFVNPVVINTDNPDRVLRRTGAVTELANPRDVDGDGIILLPSSTGEFPGYAHLPPQEKLRPVIWRTLMGNSLVDRYHSYYTERFDFVFLLPGRWLNTVTAAVNIDAGTVSFYKAGAPIEEANELLLGIRIYDVNSDGEEPLSWQWDFFREGWENGLKYYTRRASPDNPLALTDEELENAFRILSETGIN